MKAGSPDWQCAERHRSPSGGWSSQLRLARDRPCTAGQTVDRGCACLASRPSEGESRPDRYRSCRSRCNGSATPPLPLSDLESLCPPRREHTVNMLRDPAVAMRGLAAVRRRGTEASLYDRTIAPWGGVPTDSVAPLHHQIGRAVTQTARSDLRHEGLELAGFFIPGIVSAIWLRHLST